MPPQVKRRPRNSYLYGLAAGRLPHSLAARTHKHGRQIMYTTWSIQWIY